MEDESVDGLRRRIADLEAANADLVRAVAARDGFLAVAAHELRNPMTPILGRVSMLRRLVSNLQTPPATFLAKLDEIDWLITMFVKRATTLLDVSRMTSDTVRLDLAPVDVGPLARQVVENFAPLAAHAGAAIGVVRAHGSPDDPLIVLGDALALEQILDNLVSNAIKYGDGTAIAVRLARRSDTGMASLSVQDGGPGISVPAQARIFERFERAVRPGESAGGFGVGLWVVRQLSEAMGGTIAVACPPEGGSVFTVTVPLAPKEAAR